MRLFIFFSSLNKKYIGQFTYRVGNPVRYPQFIAQLCVTYCTNRALFSHYGVTGYTRWNSITCYIVVFPRDKESISSKTQN
jgi:hypothetical protein